VSLRGWFPLRFAASRTGRILLIGCNILLYSVFLWHYGWQSRNASFTDLPSFYAASIAVFRMGGSPYDYTALQAVMGHVTHVFPYLYPPPSLLLFWPLSRMDYAAARHLALILNHVILLWLLWIIPGSVLPSTASFANKLIVYALTIPYLLVSSPVQVTITSGQINFVVLASLILFWHLGRSERRLSAAFFLALSVLLKTYPIILIPFLFVGGYKREAIFTVFWLLVAVAASVLLLPAHIWQDWISNVAPTGGYAATPAGLFSPAVPWNQNLNGFFARLFTASQWSARIATYSASLLVVSISAVSIWIGREKGHGPGLDKILALSLPVMFLVAPFSWDHHIVFVFPSLLLLLTSRHKVHGAGVIPLYFALGSIAVVLALRYTVAIKFYAVFSLWVLCVLAAASRRVQIGRGVGRFDYESPGWHAVTENSHC
jgi:hypothetical protein